MGVDGPQQPRSKQPKVDILRALPMLMSMVVSGRATHAGQLPPLEILPVCNTLMSTGAHGMYLHVRRLHPRDN